MFRVVVETGGNTPAEPVISAARTGRAKNHNRTANLKVRIVCPNEFITKNRFNNYDKTPAHRPVTNAIPAIQKMKVPDKSFRQFAISTEELTCEPRHHCAP
jgi:hypothetical protein